MGMTRGPYVGHRSDCATHNEPALPNGPCSCGASAQRAAWGIKEWLEDSLEPRSVTDADLDRIAAIIQAELHKAGHYFVPIIDLSEPELVINP